MKTIQKVFEMIHAINPFGRTRHFEYVGYGIMLQGTDPMMWKQSDFGGE